MSWPTVFTWKMIKRHYEVIPLIVMVTSAVVGICGVMGYYIATTRTDVQYRRGVLPLGQRVDLDWKPKLYNLEKHKYPRDIDELRKELWNMK